MRQKPDVRLLRSGTKGLAELSIQEAWGRGPERGAGSSLIPPVLVRLHLEPEEELREALGGRLARKSGDADDD